MSRFWPSIILLCSAVLVPLRPVFAFDPTTVEILTLKLGMTKPEIVANLTQQGWRTSQSEAAVRARTGDGILLIDLSGGTARRITYTFTGRGPHEDALILTSLVDHFGTPSTRAPVSWCRAPGADGACPPAQPHLTFQPREGAIGVLTLTAGEGP